MEKPKPCPICGREPELIKVDPFCEYYIACPSIYCIEQRHIYRNKQSAIKAWNRRYEDRID